MADSPVSWFERVTLSPGVKTAILAPRLAYVVTIGNGIGTANLLEVHATDADDLHYLNVESGFERTFGDPMRPFPRGAPIYWLKHADGGTVVLIWQ